MSYLSLPLAGSDTSILSHKDRQKWRWLIEAIHDMVHERSFQDNMMTLREQQQQQQQQRQQKQQQQQQQQHIADETNDHHDHTSQEQKRQQQQEQQQQQQQQQSSGCAKISAPDTTIEVDSVMAQSLVDDEPSIGGTIPRDAVEILAACHDGFLRLLATALISQQQPSSLAATAAIVTTSSQSSQRQPFDDETDWNVDLAQLQRAMDAMGMSHILDAAMQAVMTTSAGSFQEGKMRNHSSSKNCRKRPASSHAVIADPSMVLVASTALGHGRKARRNAQRNKHRKNAWTEEEIAQQEQLLAGSKQKMSQSG